MIKSLIIVALAAEARPLIDYFRLKLQTSGAYRIYHRGPLALLETGLGKLNAAAATAAALSQLQQTQGRLPVCVNIGLAGAALPLHSLVYAHTVIDHASGKKWFPQLTWLSAADSQQRLDSASSLAVHTFDTPQLAYHNGQAFDMEASGVLCSAAKFTTLEFIQVLKVVSDNQDNPIEQISKSMASELIAEHSTTLEHVLNHLQDLADALPDSQDIANLTQTVISNVHCTTSQQSRLRHLLRSHQARFGCLPEMELLQSQPNSKALLTFLESSLAAAARKY